MSSYTVTMTVTILTPNSLPGAGSSLPTSAFSIVPTFPSNMPANALTDMDGKGHVKGTFTQKKGSITGILSSGDQVTFNFVGADSLTAITSVSLPPNDVFAWTQPGNSNNSMKGVVTSGSNVIKHTSHKEYSLGLTYNTVAYTIDPDLETDVTDAPPMP